MQYTNNYKGFDTIIDVRSPDEYRHSHIPTAYNFPVLNDDEFKQIGTLYHQDSLQAKILGASLACKNIALLLEKIASQKQIAQLFSHKNKILIYCARGGKRSQALYEVLKNLDLQVFKLQGGYKRYRQLVLHNLKIPHYFITLCGPTGCGKSELIQAYSQSSIDLESLAHHYGSSFGDLAALTLGTQPTQKMFENLLEFELSKKQINSPLIIEAESKKLGNIIIPKELYDNYHKGIFIFIDAPIEQRISRITSLYKTITQDFFFCAIHRIKPYISNKIFNDILQLWKKQDLEKVAQILIEKYYDKVYKIPSYHYKIENKDLNKALKQLKEIHLSLTTSKMFYHSYL